MDSFFQDLKHSIRMFGQSKVFTATAVLAFASDPNVIGKTISPKWRATWVIGIVGPNFDVREFTSKPPNCDGQGGRLRPGVLLTRPLFSSLDDNTPCLNSRASEKRLCTPNRVSITLFPKFLDNFLDRPGRENRAHFC